MKLLAPILLAAMLLDAQARTSTAMPTPSAQSPQVVALVAAIGDRFEVVRQRRQVGSNIEPFTRRTIQVPNQALNYAVLRGLDQAVADDEPQAKRVLLQWTMPTELADRLEKTPGQHRQELVLGALLPYMQSLPQRQSWDRIEVLVPAYIYTPMKGMGTRLSGIGVYIQPLPNLKVALGDVSDVDVAFTEADGDYRTVNPNTTKAATRFTASNPKIAMSISINSAQRKYLSNQLQARAIHTLAADPLAPITLRSTNAPAATVTFPVAVQADPGATEQIRGVSDILPGVPCLSVTLIVFDCRENTLSCVAAQPAGTQVNTESVSVAEELVLLTE